MFKVFHKGMVVFNSVKFETRSIVQIDCHLKGMHKAGQCFHTLHCIFNTSHFQSVENALQRKNATLFSLSLLFQRGVTNTPRRLIENFSPLTC